jgi:signal transduction histidine kinase
MNPSRAPRRARSRPADNGTLDPKILSDGALLEQLEERLRFERLLTNLSATFVNAPPSAVDAQIENALRQLTEFLGIERGNLGQLSEDKRIVYVTHSYVVPGFPPFPRMILDEHMPWYAEQVRRGEVLRFSHLPEDVPKEATHELARVVKSGVKAHLMIPLKVAGTILGAMAFGSFRAYREWPDELVQRLQLTGEIFANALARKRADEIIQAREESLRRTQEELQLLARRLLQAQEEERRRIAREMHDDWTQRLAILAIDAVKLERQLRASDRGLPVLRAMREQLVTLSEDVHAMSRRLHPAILDDLGLIEALRSECASLMEREKIAVDYRPGTLPGSLPGEVALCVYRIAQEALRNIAKHAVTSQAWVSLVATDRELVLSVEDRGAGFEAADTRAPFGLGLPSMQERVRLVQGALTIESTPGQGTRVTARVPLARSVP